MTGDHCGLSDWGCFLDLCRCSCFECLPPTEIEAVAIEAAVEQEERE